MAHSNFENKQLILKESIPTEGISPEVWSKFVESACNIKLPQLPEYILELDSAKSLEYLESKLWIDSLNNNNREDLPLYFAFVVYNLMFGVSAITPSWDEESKKSLATAFGEFEGATCGGLASHYVSQVLTSSLIESIVSIDSLDAKGIKNLILKNNFSPSFEVESRIRGSSDLEIMAVYGRMIKIAQLYPELLQKDTTTHENKFQDIRELWQKSNNIFGKFSPRSVVWNDNSIRQLNNLFEAYNTKFPLFVEYFSPTSLIKQKMPTWEDKSLIGNNRSRIVWTDK